MKKQLANTLLFCAICFLLTAPIAARATASQPLVFDDTIIAAVGDFVVCADEGGYMTVYTKDGAPIETQPNHNDRLENGYIVSRNCSDGGRMTVFSTAGNNS